LANRAGMGLTAVRTERGNHLIRLKKKKINGVQRNTSQKITNHKRSKTVNEGGMGGKKRRNSRTQTIYKQGWGKKE